MKRNAIKRLCSVALAGGMALSMTACGGDTGSSTPASSAPAASSESKAAETSSEASSEASGDTTAEVAVDTNTITDGNYGGLQPLSDRDDPVEFTMFIRDPGQAPADSNPVIKKIQELTGVTIKYEFLVGDQDQKIGTMIAGQDYPDIIFAGADGMKFQDAGAEIPLEDLIPQYGNLQKLYQGVTKYMQHPDGHIYNLEMYDTFAGNGFSDPPQKFECPMGFFIQKDVLKEAGYPVVKTVDQYFEIIDSYLAAHPEIDGVKTTGFEILCDGWRNWPLVNPVQNLMGAGNDGALWVDQSTYVASTFHTNDISHDYYKKLNEEFHKGTINADTFTESYNDYIAKLTTGSVLAFYDQDWNFSNAQNLLVNDGKPERTYVAVPLVEDGYTDWYNDITSGIPTGANGVGISINCKNPERLLRFYDWMLQREVQDYLQWGEEGVDWNYNEDKTDKILTAERRTINNDTDRKRDETGQTLWNYCPQVQGLWKSDGMPCGPGNSAAEYKAKQSQYDQDFLSAYGYEYPAEMFSPAKPRAAYYPVWGMNMEDGSPAALAKEKIDNLTVKWFAQLIISKDDNEYESNWKAFCDEYNKINLSDYVDEVNRQIKEKMAQ